ncbi:MAG: hypothetical protein V3S11_02395 [Elusimicrobiota bacterium]
MSARGSRSISRGRSGGKGALGQLKFAKNQSKKGAFAAGREGAFEAANAAFQGQSAGGAGTGIDGAGAGQDEGGIGTGSSPNSPSGSSALGSPGEYSCPAGYMLQESSCVPTEGSNRTPWQGLLNTARMFLIAAAILAALGLMLLLMGGAPWMQILGGALLGLAAGLAMAAVAIGNQINDRYGQPDQKSAIDSSADAANQGVKPE